MSLTRCCAGLILCRKSHRARISIYWSMTHSWNQSAKSWLAGSAFNQSICIRFPGTPVPIFAACRTIRQPARARCWTVRSCIVASAEFPHRESTFSAWRITPSITKELLPGWPIAPAHSPPSEKPEHDYHAVLASLAARLGLELPITLTDLDAHLDQNGWRPPRETLVRLAKHNTWLRSHTAEAGENQFTALPLFKSGPTASPRRRPSPVREHQNQ